MMFFTRRKKKPPTELVKEGTCPVCLSKDAMLAGPEGGLSINVMCSQCGTRLNLTGFLGHGYKLDWEHGPQPNIWGGGKATQQPDDAVVQSARKAIENE